ncbi:translation initiation factor 2 [Microvirga sp. ACRRW]|uniref:translation initiation factor 2 n=1 Tax=Microvirga sp. ACRRW TaxID=2918205 RepID=UPI001EF6302D|nr:translation initiation factor 2 [Microvirga sp. ACRRW]MCG7391437.1 translation initiation factor 2 [Microvirga sp. ACRRW]
MRLSILAVLAGSLSLGACATVTRGTTEQITFDSTPPAEMRTSTGLTCPTTPCTLDISRKSEFIATFSKQGYQSQDVMVQTRLAGAGAAGFAGNVLVGGVIGMGVDAATGSTLEHYPNPVTVSLVPLVLSRKNKPQKPAVSRGPVKEQAAPTS